MPRPRQLRVALETLGMLTAAALAPPPLRAQSGAFVVRRGTDTVFVERYARTSTGPEGDQGARSAQAPPLPPFPALLGPRGHVVPSELTGRPAARPGAP